jgi:hypothetical protein
MILNHHFLFLDYLSDLNCFFEGIPFKDSEDKSAQSGSLISKIPQRNIVPLFYQLSDRCTSNDSTFQKLLLGIIQEICRQDFISCLPILYALIKCSNQNSRTTSLSNLLQSQI